MSHRPKLYGVFAVAPGQKIELHSWPITKKQAESLAGNKEQGLRSGVFKEKSKPSSEQVELWENEYRKADALRKKAVDYLWYGPLKPNTTIGNYRVVEKGKRLEAEGFLTKEETDQLRALERFYVEYPQLKNPDSPDNRQNWGVVTEDGSIRLSTPVSRHPEYEANIRNERINAAGKEERMI